MKRLKYPKQLLIIHSVLSSTFALAVGEKNNKANLIPCIRNLSVPCLFRFIITLFFLAHTATSSFAQSLSEVQAIEAAFRSHPTLRLSKLTIDANRYAEKAAFNLPNPEVNIESPSGEFYTVGVSQSFEFPTVYKRQKSVAKAETALAQAGQKISENDLRRNVRSLYLEAQIADYQVDKWQVRDSLYRAIVQTAVREFDAGQIDFLAKTLAENEAGSVKQAYKSAQLFANMLHKQLALYTQSSVTETLEKIKIDSSWLVEENTATNNPILAYGAQSMQVAASQLDLAKSRALPNFSIGYLNQGARNSVLDYRFRAGVGIPLWTGQYKAANKVAEAESEAAQVQQAVQQQALSMELSRNRLEAQLLLNDIRYHEQEAIPRSEALISAALRMRQAGQTDYQSFLRTLDTAFEVQRIYRAKIQAFEALRIGYLYLIGE